jgi:very-short-patch-repair endonuclease
VLLLGSRNKNVRAVMAFAPSGIVWQGLNFANPMNMGPAWTAGGKPLPFVTPDQGAYRANTPMKQMFDNVLADADKRPETQIPVLQGSYPVAFLDMGWPEFMVAVEYDGDHHRKDRRQYVKDIARLRMLEALGWIVIRVIAEDKAKDVIARVEAALVSRGCVVEIDELQRFTRTFAA